MSSPITLSGFNGIDFQSIINIMVQAAQQPITDLNTQKSTAQTKLTTYGSFSTSLSSLKTAFDDLSSESTYDQINASSSDSTVLGVSADSSAQMGIFNIVVNTLARPQVTTSTDNSGGQTPTYGRVADINAPVINGGSFSITPHGGTPINIDLTGVQTLAQFRDALNARKADTGVTASIINDGVDPNRPFRLVLTSTSTGTQHDFSWNDNLVYTGDFNLNLSTDPSSGTAKDSVFTYNGITIKNSSTSVADAIPGLTLNLFKEGPASVTVSEDDSSLMTNITALVTAFNSFDDFTKQQTTGSSNVLQGDPLLRGANRELRSLLISAHPNSGTFQYLSQIGIGLDRDGKLQIDDAMLSDALANHRDDVKTLLTGASGLAAQVSNAINGYTESGGSIDGTESRLQSTISSYDTRIQTLQSQLSLYQQDLQQQFTAADQAISQLNSQVSALSALDNQYRLF